MCPLCFCELHCNVPTICCVFCVYLRVTMKICGCLATFVISYYFHRFFGNVLLGILHSLFGSIQPRSVNPIM
jgi:hypothetical protein